MPKYGLGNKGWGKQNPRRRNKKGGKGKGGKPKGENFVMYRGKRIWLGPNEKAVKGVSATVFVVNGKTGKATAIDLYLERH